MDDDNLILEHCLFEIIEALEWYTQNNKEPTIFEVNTLQVTIVSGHVNQEVKLNTIFKKLYYKHKIKINVTEKIWFKPTFRITYFANSPAPRTTKLTYIDKAHCFIKENLFKLRLFVASDIEIDLNNILNKYTNILKDSGSGNPMRLANGAIIIPDGALFFDNLFRLLYLTEKEPFISGEQFFNCLKKISGEEGSAKIIRQYIERKVSKEKINLEKSIGHVIYKNEEVDEISTRKIKI